ncbi:unknown [Eggerthella sp. CAG:1427]|nr:unknown [Eggerthella sp. CAG:1427]
MTFQDISCRFQQWDVAGYSGLMPIEGKPQFSVYLFQIIVFQVFQIDIRYSREDTEHEQVQYQFIIFAELRELRIGNGFYFLHRQIHTVFFLNRDTIVEERGIIQPPVVCGNGNHLTQRCDIYTDRVV